MNTRAASRSPFEILADFEQRSLAHVVGAQQQADAPGVWRGIGFRVGQRHLLGAIGDVNEILAVPSLTPVPGTRDWLLGVANVRGNLVPVVDMAGFIDGVASLLSDNSRLLLVRQPAGSVGLLVDEVFGQRTVASEQLNEVDAESDPAVARYVRERVQSGSFDWGLFNVGALVRSVEFQQAAL
ncbi:MAG: chemotaxis protein CheW [Dokdonella sp.]